MKKRGGKVGMRKCEEKGEMRGVDDQGSDVDGSIRGKDEQREYFLCWKGSRGEDNERKKGAEREVIEGEKLRKMLYCSVNVE